MTALCHAFKRDQRGAALMEFGLIAPVFALLIMGMLDIGHGMYVKSVLSGAVQKAGRDSTLQTGVVNAAAIDAAVWDITRRAVPNGTFSVTRTSFQDFANAGKAEPFVDGNGNGVRNAGECFQDINGDGVWSASAGTNGQGGASDAVIYTATVTYPHFFPMPSLLNMFPGAGNAAMSTQSSMSASTVLRNQPFATDQQPNIICS